MQAKVTYLMFRIGLALFIIAFMGFYNSLYAQRSIFKRPEKLVDSGIASYYDTDFEGKLTSTGETFSNSNLTAASNTLPLGTLVKVTNKKNGKWVLVRINDRMHKHNKRIIDLSRQAAEKLNMIQAGLIQVKVQVIPRKFFKLFDISPVGIRRAHSGNKQASSK